MLFLNYYRKNVNHTATTKSAMKNNKRQPLLEALEDRTAPSITSMMPNVQAPQANYTQTDNMFVVDFPASQGDTDQGYGAGSASNDYGSGSPGILSGSSGVDYSSASDNNGLINADDGAIAPPPPAWNAYRDTGIGSAAGWGISADYLTTTPTDTSNDHGTGSAGSVDTDGSIASTSVSTSASTSGSATLDIIRQAIDAVFAMQDF
jgi:hypothetical protein